jgi:hypothetical protein
VFTFYNYIFVLVKVRRVILGLFRLILLFMRLILLFAAFYRNIRVVSAYFIVYDLFYCLC